MKRLINYLGQLRIYSLVDWMLLLIVSGANFFQFAGGVFMHIGFLGFLESQHQHPNREPVSDVHAIAVCMSAAAMFGGDMQKRAYYFLFFSGIYALKKYNRWALVSPVARGMQVWLILQLLLPFDSALLWCAAIGFTVRNALGDFRDIEHDRAEGMRTWPVALRVKQDWVFVHLVATLTTTWLWWSFSSLPMWIPTALNIVEVGTYWLTPRPSNKKAAQELRKILQCVWG